MNQPKTPTHIPAVASSHKSPPLCSIPAMNLSRSRRTMNIAPAALPPAIKPNRKSLTATPPPPLSVNHSSPHFHCMLQQINDLICMSHTPIRHLSPFHLQIPRYHPDPAPTPRNHVTPPTTAPYTTVNHTAPVRPTHSPEHSRPILAPPHSQTATSTTIVDPPTRPTHRIRMHLSDLSIHPKHTPIRHPPTTRTPPQSDL